MTVSHLVLALVACACVQQVQAQTIHITVDAAGHPRRQTIVEAQLKPDSLRSSGSYRAVNQKTKRSSIVQQGGDGKIAFILPDALQAHEQATYKIVKAAPARSSPVSVEHQEQGVQVKVGGKPLLFYNTAVQAPPAGMSDIYARSGFIHPLTSPAGKVLTDDFPVGHAHQHGIMMAWTSTTFRDTEHDFWNRHRKLGNVRHVKVRSIEPGPVISTVKLRLQHVSPLHGEVLNETWTIRVYPFVEHFVFDIQSEQKNTSADPLLLNKYHYGGAGLRASKHWNPDDPQHFQGAWQIATDADSTPERTNGKPAAYVSVSGSIDGAPAGVTVFGFPQNLHYPQPIRAHPTMPYFSFTPVVNQGHRIGPGEVYRSAYRYLVHDGSPDRALIARLNDDLLRPVKTKVRYR